MTACYRVPSRLMEAVYWTWTSFGSLPAGCSVGPARLLSRVVMLKRRFGTRFVMAVHDLIPIYARETCDQGTARVFEALHATSAASVDHVLAVSENTANDLRRYVNSLRLPEPLITVTKNGSSFAEFLPRGEQPGQLTLLNLPERFVLFVAQSRGGRITNSSSKYGAG